MAKVTACCGTGLYSSERMSEEQYPYGEVREVLCCRGCGIEMPRMVEADDLFNDKTVRRSWIADTILKEVEHGGR